MMMMIGVQGANAVFNLQTQIAIGERCVMALASGAAVRLAALPPPAPPRIKVRFSLHARAPWLPYKIFHTQNLLLFTVKYSQSNL
jgi:hypothetical protein